jgi:hypothetical protein
MRRFLGSLATTSFTSIFTYPELTKGIEDRKVAEKQLQTVSLNAKQRLSELASQFKLQKIDETEFAQRYSSLKKEIVDKAEVITFGARNRDAFLKANGCVKINNECIQAIKDLKMNIVEYGAGVGHWAKALSQQGKLDVKAFDNMEFLPIPDEEKQFPVEKTKDANVLRQYGNRALLLVYPPPGPMALTALEAHNGKVLIYCGEGRGGANANDDFFDRLESQFKVIKTVTEFERFGTMSFERMWIMTRK